MTNVQATAEIFLMALKSLPKRERDAVLARIARDKDFGRELLDLATISARRDEPSRPFRKFLAEKNRK